MGLKNTLAGRLLVFGPLIESIFLISLFLSTVKLQGGQYHVASEKNYALLKIIEIWSLLFCRVAAKYVFTC